MSLSTRAPGVGGGGPSHGTRALSRPFLVDCVQCRHYCWSQGLEVQNNCFSCFYFRQIFERIIHINLSSKKMKLFFKRYLDFERKYGDAFSVENVKTKAMEYVESKTALS